MIDFIKKNISVLLIFIIALSVGFLTFLTFINRSFIQLNDINLQILLIINVILIIVFILIIISQIKNSIKNNINVTGSKANIKYITFFSLFTLIPSILISIFSLFLFSFALEKYLDKKITTAVNNSYEIAKNYVEDVKNKIESDIVLIGYDLDKYINFYYDDPNKYKNILKTQKLIRDVDEIHLINSLGNLIVTTLNDESSYNPPPEKALKMVFAVFKRFSIS